MANPIAALTPRIQGAIASSFGSEYEDTDPVIRPSDHADLQINVAMSLAKKVGKAPRDVAAAIVAHLDVDDIASAVEIAGPGFINVTIRDDFVAQALESFDQSGLGIERTGEGKTVVIDYSAPNVAKEMHVGHLRSTIIGDALARVFAVLGWKVIRQNHLGDWGTPFGMLIEHLVDEGATADTKDFSIGDLNAFYKDARQKFDSDPGFADRARERVVKLQAGDQETLALWRVLFDESKHHFNEVYSKLGILLTDDDIVGESFYNDELPGIAEDLEQRGLARIDDGALVGYPTGFANREGEAAGLIVRKREGGYNYATTDLATVRYRTNKLGADRLVYVTDSGQSLHFAMVWQLAHEAGFIANDIQPEHVPFGLVLGEDNKRFKSRSGDTEKLVALIDEGIERAGALVADKNPDLSEEERAAVANAVGIGAIKYADLSNTRTRDYVFSWDRMLAFDGNTAPYLQYAHARIMSILRRAADAGISEGKLLIATPQEKRLAFALLGLPETVQRVADTLEPHHLATYLYETASAYTTFYEACPVLKAETPELQQSRLRLCRLTAEVLAQGLDLLGIQAPDRM